MVGVLAIDIVAYTYDKLDRVKTMRYNDVGVLVTYTYDAWGKLLSVTNASGTAITSSTHIANINPIRYRGYFYDTETKLYYCNNRYYDPQIKRFINADVLLSTGTGFLGYNMFAYCENNPVMYCDPSGFIRAPGYVNGVWSTNPDAYEFGENSDTYKIILDLTDRWYAASSQSDRNSIHYLAEDARRVARAGTP